VTTLQAGSATVVGQVRAANEDSHLVLDDLVIVADGMGGHRGGAVASATTVRVVGDTATGGTLEDLVSAVQRANRQVFDDARADPSLRGMGTTVCLVGLVDHEGSAELAVLNVGDSRVYLLSGGLMEQLTEDHSLVETLVREGRLTPEDAEVHPQRNVLTRALGVDPGVTVDAWLLRPADGDRLLLCSDGLFNEVAEDRIAELLAEPDAPELVARRLCAEADAAGGRDNITVVVLDVSDTGRAPEPLVDRYRRFSTPAVDLFGEDDGPHTDTVLAVVGTGSPQGEAAAAGPSAGNRSHRRPRSRRGTSTRSRVRPKHRSCRRRRPRRRS
jgi:serine/threonine protein phosphatase PrpC